MQDKEKVKYITVGKVARRLDVGPATITNWYAAWHDWLETGSVPEGCPGLPEYEQEEEGCTRYWSEEDIPQLEAFKAWRPRGCVGLMGKTNSKYQGGRGKKYT